jgi:hypothetical protein
MKKRKNVFWNRSKKDLKIYFINLDLKKLKVDFISLHDFLSHINFGLKSKDKTRQYEISNIWHHTKVLKFKNHFKFFSDIKDAEKYLNEINQQKKAVQ